MQLRNPLRSRDIAKTLGEINADKGIPNADELDAEEDLSHYFSEPPVKRMIHLIVRLPPGEYPPYAESCTSMVLVHPVDYISATPAKSYGPSRPLDTQSPLRQTQILRELYVKNFPDTAPSSQGVPSEFAQLQRDERHAIRWNRPPSATSSIPSTLLHPIFGEFIDDCENHKPSPDDNKLVWKLSMAMSGFFEDEKARASKFREIL